MKTTTNLYDATHARLIELFGPPRQPGRASWKTQWTINFSPRSGAINILLDANRGGVSPAHPAIWVFDPAEPDDGVLCRAIKSEADLEAMITLIKGRILNHAESGLR